MQLWKKFSCYCQQWIMLNILCRTRLCTFLVFTDRRLCEAIRCMYSLTNDVCARQSSGDVFRAGVLDTNFVNSWVSWRELDHLEGTTNQTFRRDYVSVSAKLRACTVTQLLMIWDWFVRAGILIKFNKLWQDKPIQSFVHVYIFNFIHLLKIRTVCYYSVLVYGVDSTILKLRKVLYCALIWPHTYPRKQKLVIFSNSLDMRIFLLVMIRKPAS